MQTFYAKVDTYNQTTYETNTLSVLLKDDTRLTLRVGEEEEVVEGEVYLFEVEPVDFKGREQFLVHTHTHISAVQLSYAEKEKVMGAFYNFAPIPIDDIKVIIESYLEKITNPTLRTITLGLYKKHENDFYLYPAATRFHHAYIGGVAHHTSTMLELIEGFVKTYPFLNKELLIAGIVLHDLFKIVELSNYYAPEYTKEGKLIGHIAMGVEKIGEVAHKEGVYDTEERLLLQHMVLSHHYYGNFGSPKKPNIPEALALHFIDNIDSKFAVLGEALKQTQEGEFTPSLGVLDRERYYKSKLK